MKQMLEYHRDVRKLIGVRPGQAVRGLLPFINNCFHKAMDKAEAARLWKQRQERKTIQ